MFDEEKTDNEFKGKERNLHLGETVEINIIQWLYELNIEGML